jgi:hypothetical protein
VFAAAIISESAKGLQANPTIFPVALLVQAAYVLNGYLLLVFTIKGTGVSEVVEQLGDGNLTPDMCIFQEASWVGNARTFNLFSFLWTTFFLESLRLYMIAGKIGCWYFPESEQRGAMGFLKDGVSVSLGTVSITGFFCALVYQIVKETRKKCHNICNPIVLLLISIGTVCATCLQMVKRRTKTAQY